ncbi:MAG TPA: GGDEF domain-containing protein [Actinomycetota bacterium]
MEQTTGQTDHAETGDQGGETVAELRCQLDEAREALRRRTEEVGLLRLQLDALSTTELTTGLLNRAGLLEAIETALHRLGRLDEPFAVVGVRIPSLARIAERGPAATKEALRHVGAMIAAGLRDLDRTGRIDDTTFVAVASLKAPDAYAVVLERLKAMLGGGSLTIGEATVDPDPQFCVVLAEPSARGEPTSILQLAEDLLLRASETNTPVVRL